MGTAQAAQGPDQPLLGGLGVVDLGEEGGSLLGQPAELAPATGDHQGQVDRPHDEDHQLHWVAGHQRTFGLGTLYLLEQQQGVAARQAEQEALGGAANPFLSLR